MDIIRSVAELRARLQREPDKVFVPTMGNLHDGHIQLINFARSRSACVVVSIFVNRLQFGPREDFDRYPRTFDADRTRLEHAGVNVLFAPYESEVYPEPQSYLVEPSDLQNILEGAFRPGHFRGVATVVLKFFNMVSPGSAIFGKKDYQQYVVLRDMVLQLALPINIIAGETVRASDGLALSSRNSYLTQEERRKAPLLYQMLCQFRDEIIGGVTDFRRLEVDALRQLENRGWQPNYVAVRRQQDLQLPQAGDHSLVVLAAGRLGTVRLIDSLEIPSLA